MTVEAADLIRKEIPDYPNTQFGEVLLSIQNRLIPPSPSRIPNSEFRIPHSTFHIPPSVICHLPSVFWLLSFVL